MDIIKTGSSRLLHRKHSLKNYLAGLLFALAVPLASQAAPLLSEVAVSSGIPLDGYSSSTMHGLGVNWIDFDNDGWDDLFVVNGFNKSPHLYRNNGDGATFTKVDELLPALPNVEMMGSVYADYDNDGDSDIYIFTDNENGPVGPTAGPPNLLLKNLWVESGRAIPVGTPLFVDVAAAAGVQDLLDVPLPDGVAYRAASGGWLDYDRDGYVDLYVCHWDRQNIESPTNADRLYRNLGDGTFEDVTVSSGVNDGSNPVNNRPCLAFAGMHLDDDLWPDMYVVNLDDPLPYSQDMIFQNQGAGASPVFIDRIPDMPTVGDDSRAGMGVTTADIDHDGDWDLYLSDLIGSLEGPGSNQVGNPLYLHTGVDILYNDNSARAAGVELNSSWGVNFFDVDHDGYDDLFVSTVDSVGADILYQNNTDGTFTDVSLGANTGTGNSRGSGLSDYDHDGDLDIAVVQTNGFLKLYRNDTPNKGHWLQIDLAASVSNRDAIGTLVKVTAGGTTYMRQVIGGSSAHSQDSLRLHFGLGDAVTADLIQVFWPSGVVQELTDQPADTVISVFESDSPTIVSPIPGTVLSGDTVTFSWTPNGEAVTSWQLRVGTSPGASDLYDSGVLPAGTLSGIVAGLPTDGSAVYARLSYEIGGVVTDADYEYIAINSSAPSMIAPIPGSTLPGDTVTFSWAANGQAVSTWQLLVGTAPGTGDLYDSGSLAAATTTATVPGLPTDGSPVHARLIYEIGGILYSVDYDYTAATIVSGQPGIVSPVPGSVLPGSAVTFTWSANGADVTTWSFVMGTSQGGNDLYVSGVLPSDVLFANVTGLPTDGSTLYARLRYKVDGVTFRIDYEFTAASNSSGVPGITAPAAGTVLPGDTVEFSWADNGAAVTAWEFLVGTSAGAGDLYSSGVLAYTSQSATVTGLPTDGSTVYVRLRYESDGAFSEIDYQYTAFTPGSGEPAIVDPAAGSTLPGPEVTFSWSANGADVTKWQLYIGSTPGTSDLYRSRLLTPDKLSLTVSGLPTDGSKVYARLRYEIAGSGTTSEVVVEYTAAGSGTPALVAPVPGSVLPGDTATFGWADNGSAVTSWELLVGTSAGAGDLYSSGTLAASTLSAEVSGLPTDGSTVYVRLRYEIDSAVTDADYQYTAATIIIGEPSLTTPVPGSVLPGDTATFGWGANGSAVTAWELLVGTAAGAGDLYSGGVLDASTLSVDVTGLPVDGSTIHVRLRYEIDGVFAELDYQYTAASPAGPDPEITDPVPGSVLSGATVTFNWTANGAAVSKWQLYIGSTPELSDIYRSRVLSSDKTSLTVGNLPVDGSTVYVRLRYKIDGSATTESVFEYTAASTP